jgi:tetratricopeptide (TPR) repeat protein
VNPLECEAPLAQLRLHPGEIRNEDLRPFIPKIDSLAEDDERWIPLAVALARTASVHAAATWAIERRPWRFAAVHYGLSGVASRWYMRYVGNDDLYGGVVQAAFELQDAMLGRLIMLAPPETRIVLISEHGFLSGHQRPSNNGLKPPPDDWQRAHGLFAMKGPGIRKDELVHGARLVDVAPTILAAHGITAPACMQGRVLTEAFTKPPVTVLLPTASARSTEEDCLPEDAAQLLAEFGYVDTVEPHIAEALLQHENREAFALAVTHVSSGRPDAAIAPLARLLEREPQNAPAKVYLAACYAMTSRFDESLSLLGETRWPGSLDVFALMIRGRCLLALCRTPEALKLLKDAALVAESPMLLSLLADVSRVSGRILEAERGYRAALHKDDSSVSAHAGLAEILLIQTRYEEAAATALDATSLDFGQARAHYVLGLALIPLGRRDAAAQALRNCLMVDPLHAGARKVLGRILPARRQAST